MSHGGTGWPAVPAGRYGGRLGLVPGFVVFSPPPEVGNQMIPARDRSLARPSAVGWPRISSTRSATTCSSSEGAASRAGGGHPSGLNGTDRVREDGMSDSRRLNRGLSSGNGFPQDTT